MKEKKLRFILHLKLDLGIHEQNHYMTIKQMDVWIHSTMREWSTYQDDEGPASCWISSRRKGGTKGMMLSSKSIPRVRSSLRLCASTNNERNERKKARSFLEEKEETR